MFSFIGDLLGLIRCFFGGHLWTSILNGQFCFRCGAFKQKGP